ncbi:MAG: hypothetical protein QGG36_07820 [Pirellulaceae bacterium]|jgi:hypothetical protein|nr:hypothetical protein [Pirellulaceae bacterium]MDP7015692.1 hypothetical protein [Pirellulaceae bacterium]
MTSLLILTALLAAPPVTGDLAKADGRRYHEISKDLRRLSRAEAGKQAKPERAATIQEMTELYLELKRDPRLDTSDTLKGYRIKLRSRLMKIQRDLEREFKVPRQTKRQPNAPMDPALVLLTQELTSSLTEQLELVNGSLGGPGQVFAEAQRGAQGARGGIGKADYGPDLIELIKSTIAPDFWDDAGGPGSIFYYKPVLALVVSATAEVHEQLGGVLGGLRRVMN